MTVHHQWAGAGSESGARARLDAFVAEHARGTLSGAVEGGLTYAARCTYAFPVWATIRYVHTRMRQRDQVHGIRVSCVGRHST